MSSHAASDRSHPFPAHAYEHLLAHRDRIRGLTTEYFTIARGNNPADAEYLTQVNDAIDLARYHERAILAEWYCDSSCVRCGFATTSGNYCARCRRVLDDFNDDGA